MCVEYFSNTKCSPLEDKRKVQHKKLRSTRKENICIGVKNEDPSPSTFQEYLWCTSLKVEETNHQVRDEEGNRMRSNYLGLKLACLCISGPKSDICLGFSILQMLCVSVFWCLRWNVYDLRVKMHKKTLSPFKGAKSCHQIGRNPNTHHEIIIIVINGDKIWTQNFLMNLDCRGNLGGHKMTKWHARTPLTFSSIALNAYHIMHKCTQCAKCPVLPHLPWLAKTACWNLKQHYVLFICLF